MTPEERGFASMGILHSLIASEVSGPLRTYIERMVRDAVAKEREACAKIADEIEDSMAVAIAERIRARGKG